MIQKGTSATWWGTDGSAALKPYYDDLEQAYEEQRFKVINGGGGQNPEPSPTPAPGNTPIPFPTTVPVPGDIPTFKELVAPALAGGAAVINMTQGAWECMAEAVSSLWNNMMQSDTSTLTGNPFSEEKLIAVMTNDWSASSDYDKKFVYSNGNTVDRYDLTVNSNGTINLRSRIYKTNAYYPAYAMDTYSFYTVKGKIAKEYKFYGDSSVSRGYDGNPGTITYQIFVPYTLNGKQYNPMHKVSKEEIWVHPDLQDTYKNNGKLEYPQQAPRPLQIPSGEQLADTVKKLNPEINTEYSPEMAPNYIQELIQQLQKNPSTDPDPNPNPDPAPDPDPNPDPDPDVKPTGVPEPEPTQKPDEDSSSNLDPKDYAIDLSKIFPFCIPFDLIHLLNVLDAEPEAPRFEIPVDLEADNPFTGKKIVDYHTKIVVDLSDYEQPIKVIRIFEVMFFILALLLITRDQMIKG